MIAEKNYYLDSKGELANDGKDAAFLLVAKGQEIPPHFVKRYGLGAKTKPAPAENKVAEPASEIKTEFTIKVKAETPNKRPAQRKK